MRSIHAAVTAAVIVTLAVVAALVSDVTDPVAPRTTVDTDDAEGATATARPRDPIMLGATGQYMWEIQRREDELGKHLEAARVFRRWGQPLFGDDQAWARDTGHTIFISIKSRYADGTKIEWRDIANAKPGSALHDEMLRQARQLEDFGAVLYVTFNHEPDARTSAAMGGPAQFVAAWREVVETHREAGVTNARYVWVMTDAAFHDDAEVAEAYYPGDAYVDHIGVDAYNWFGCTTEKPGDGRWRSPAEILAGHRRFGERHPDKGLMVLEWGSVEDPNRPGRKARWIRDATALLLRPGWKQYRAILHYDRRSLEGSQSPCRWDYRTSPSAFAAWRDMGHHPAYDAQSPQEIEALTRRSSDPASPPDAVSRPTTTRHPTPDAGAGTPR